MSFISTFLLLAACSTTIIAGPVPKYPRRQLFASYSNTSVAITPTAEAIQSSSSTVDLSSALASTTLSGVAPIGSVTANTALIVEPIQQTVRTSIIPAVTFVLPDGEPLATGDPQTVFSTSFIKTPPAPTTEESSSIMQTPSFTPSPESTPIESSPTPLSSTAGTVENGTATETSQQVPKFTYSPIEEETSVSLAPSSALATSAKPVQTTGGLPGFDHPGAGNSTAIQTPMDSSSAPEATTEVSPSGTTDVPEVPMASASAPMSSIPAPDNAAPSSFVTKTEYTTVFASSSPSEAAPVGSALPTEDQEPMPPVSNGLAEASESLQVPPVVIVTSFTTVMPTPEPKPTEVPVSSAGPEPEEPIPSSTYAIASSSQVAEPIPTPPAVSSLTTVIPTPTPAPPAESPSAPPTSMTDVPEVPTQPPSSTTPPPETSPQPSSPPLPPPETPAQPTSSTPEPSPSPSDAPEPTDAPSSSPPMLEPVPSSISEAPSASSPAPEPTSEVPAPTDAPAPSSPESAAPVPSSTAEGPLIITPIPPSQVFTVTVTATDKETVRETSTVTVTAG